jgi:hypothetical protein
MWLPRRRAVVQQSEPRLNGVEMEETLLEENRKPACGQGRKGTSIVGTEMTVRVLDKERALHGGNAAQPFVQRCFPSLSATHS